MTLSTIEVTGKLVSPATINLNGYKVTLTLSAAISDGDSPEVLPVPRTVFTASDGTFTFPSMYCNDGGAQPSGTYYTATVTDPNNHRVGKPWSVQLLVADGPTVDLFSLITVYPQPPLYGVAQLIAGDGIELDPSGGVGIVTVSVGGDGEFSSLGVGSSPSGVSGEIITPLMTLKELSNAIQMKLFGTVSAPAVYSLQASNGTDYADYTYDGNNADLDTSKGGINLRPLDGSNVAVWSPLHNTKFEVGSQGFTQALSFQHDGTNAHINSSNGYIGFASDTFQILSNGAVNYTGPTSGSASAGSNGALPATVGGYFVWEVAGFTVKLPYYFV